MITITIENLTMQKRPANQPPELFAARAGTAPAIMVTAFAVAKISPVWTVGAIQRSRPRQK